MQFLRFTMNYKKLGKTVVKSVIFSLASHRDGKNVLFF